MDIQKERELFLAHMRSIGSAGFMFELDEDGNFDDMSMSYAWSAWQAAKAQAVLECTWSHDSDEDMHGTWHTECGNSFVLNEDGPTENQMNYCCYCGGKLIEAQEPSHD